MGGLGDGSDRASCSGHDATRGEPREHGNGDVVNALNADLGLVSENLEPNPNGRVFEGSRRVRLGDVASSGRIRLDALARYLQDVATDDATDARLADGWVLRRIGLRVDEFPQFRDEVELATWCSGTARSAAERRTRLRVGGRTLVEAIALWVFVGRDGRPVRLDPAFFEPYGAAARDRRVSTRLRLGEPGPRATADPWRLRSTDFDVLRHVNNAISLAALEDAIAAAGWTEWDAATPLGTVEVEYRAALDPGDAPDLVVELDGRGDTAQLDAWLASAGSVRTSMRVRLRGASGAPA
jgi:acyl-ACP thioesterase